MRIFSVFLLFLSFTAIKTSCQVVELSGSAPQFSNEFLLVSKIMNPITGRARTIDTIAFDKTGNFKTQISTENAGWIFINSGVFRIVMYTHPGTGYLISLPPKTSKSEADIRNPFYTPVIAHIQVLEEYSLENENSRKSFSDINSKIFRFDTLLSSANTELLNAIRRQENYNSDSLINALELNFKNDTSDFFSNYRRYRYGIVKINSRDVGLKYIFDHYLVSDFPETDNPAYIELFGEMYKEFLFFFSRTDEGKSVKYIVDRLHNKSALLDTLRKHEAVPSRQLAELIVLKEIYDIYSKDYFYKESLIMLLDSISAKPSSPEYAEFAKEIKHYLIRLKTGEEPPAWSLLDMNKQVKTLNDYSGKYVYLNFCTPDNYSCLKEFPFLKALHNAHKERLEIITIMVTENFEDMRDFMTKNNYEWPSLFYGNNEELLLDYDVRAFPTCYLIDPKGRLVQSPAALATEGFEQHLFRIMRSRGDL